MPERAATPHPATASPQPRAPAGLCAVTGAGGYVGGVIADYLERAGVGVARLTRTDAPVRDTQPGRPGLVRRFRLTEPTSPVLFEGVDSLIHAAWDFGPRDSVSIRRINIDGTLRLFKAAQGAGVRTIIFVSTMSAFEGCRSMYGLAKFDIERTQHRFGQIIVRPGLVYGDAPGGMVGSLSKLARIPLLTPLVGMGGQVMHLAHQEDLGQLMHRLLTIPDAAAPTRPIPAANEHGHTMREIMKTLSRGPKLPIPIPWPLVFAGLRTLEAVGVRTRLRSDSLISLLNQDPKPDFGPLREVGVEFREFAPWAGAPRTASAASP